MSLYMHRMLREDDVMETAVMLMQHGGYVMHWLRPVVILVMQSVACMNKLPVYLPDNQEIHPPNLSKLQCASCLQHRQLLQCVRNIGFLWNYLISLVNQGSRTIKFDSFCIVVYSNVPSHYI